MYEFYQKKNDTESTKPTILGQSYNVNDTINADIGNTIHPKFSEFRLKVKQSFLYKSTNEKIQNMQRMENTQLFSSKGRNSSFRDKY